MLSSKLKYLETFQRIWKNVFQRKIQDEIYNVKFKFLNKGTKNIWIEKKKREQKINDEYLHSHDPYAESSGSETDIMDTN